MKASLSQSRIQINGLGVNLGKSISIVAYKSVLGVQDSISDTDFDLNTKYVLMSFQFNTTYKLSPVSFSLRQGFQYSLQQISNVVVNMGFEAFVADGVDNTIYKFTPNPVLQGWYDSLIVKPSAGLWTDLKNMTDGMSNDGDWNEMDLISVHAALETNEQRLRPFKNTAGVDYSIVGTPVIDSEGFLNDFSGSGVNCIKTGWKSAIHGVKFKLNDAYIGIYGDTVASSTSSAFNTIGCVDNNGGTLLTVFSTTTNVTISGTNIYLNSNNGLTGNLSKGGLANLAKRYYASNARTSSVNCNKFINGNTQTTTQNSNALTNEELIILGYMDIGSVPTTDTTHKSRALIVGSSNISSPRVSARLNTFFSARGLTISNY